MHHEMKVRRNVVTQYNVGRLEDHADKSSRTGILLRNIRRGFNLHCLCLDFFWLIFLGASPELKGIEDCGSFATRAWHRIACAYALDVLDLG